MEDDIERMARRLKIRAHEAGYAMIFADQILSRLKAVKGEIGRLPEGFRTDKVLQAAVAIAAERAADPHGLDDVDED